MLFGMARLLMVRGWSVSLNSAVWCAKKWRKPSVREGFRGLFRTAEQFQIRELHFQKNAISNNDWRTFSSVNCRIQGWSPVP
jgi:hypothetical protein